MTGTKSFPEFIQEFRDQLAYLFHERSDIDALSVTRGLPPYILREIMSGNPLATYVPRKYGGRGGSVKEGLELASVTAYESLPRSLAFGINWALFLQPVAKYAQESVKQGIFSDFLGTRQMGAMLLTGP